MNRAIPLLQKTDADFIHKSGCVSCHNNNLAALTIADARRHRVPVDENVARSQVRFIAGYLETNRELALQGTPPAGGADTLGYILLGLAAENHPPDQGTDAMARCLKNSQKPDGSWSSVDIRPPLESSDIETTAAAMRSVQVYGIRTRRADYDQVAQRAAAWLAGAQPNTTEDRVFRLLGLTWSKAPSELLQKAVAALLAGQRSDGGWAQIPSLSSDAYATGQALVALQESGLVSPSGEAYQRGVAFLVSTQLEDGSWFVRSRTPIPFQPYFEAGFPHGTDQFISAAGSNWATRALIASLE